MIDNSSEASLYRRAVALLTRREHGAQELAQKLLSTSTWHREPISPQSVIYNADDSVKNSTNDSTASEPTTAIESTSASEDSTLKEPNGTTQPLSREPDESTVLAVIAKLQRQGYQSDERFADVSTRHYFARGYGITRVRQTLQQKGVALDLINQAIKDNAKDEFDPDYVLQQTWKKKFGVAPGDMREKAKQTRFLVSRGFSYDEIARLFDSLKSTL